MTSETVSDLKDWQDDPKEESRLTIIKCVNGYLLLGIDCQTGYPVKFVIEDDPQDELKSHESLLWEVMEYFGFGGSKHDKERIKIERIKRGSQKKI